MDDTIPVLESPAMPAIKQVKNMLEYDTEELMDQVEEFKAFVNELNDYSWRLTDKEKVFLELALELQKRLVKDVAFITTTENISECHTEMEDAMEKRIVVTKERIQLQEETLSLNMAAEEAVENRVEVDIQYDVAKLIRTRSFLARLQEQADRLGDDMDKVIFDSEVAKRYKGEIEEFHARAVEAAYAVV
ncbi:hypothetical protein QL285_057993 [Trifolium repens]|jgi:hypothetical protein|nr:hypothetical protein QL285_057993 [Trifolium repens]